MRKFRNVLMSTLSVLVLSACGNASTGSADATLESSETAAVESNVSKEKTKTVAKGNRTNPYKVGETARLENEFQDRDGNPYPAVLDLTLSNPLRGEEAYNYLVSVTNANQPAPEGYEWLVVDITGTLVDGDENVPLFHTAELSSVSASGSPAPDASYFLNSYYGGVDLYQGGTTTGQKATLVPAGEPYTVKVTVQYSESVFFTFE